MVMSLSLSKLHFGLSATKNLLVVDNVMHYLRGAKHYENRNVLNLYTRGMFEDMFPSNSRFLLNFINSVTGRYNLIS